jgi:surface antigen
VLRTILPKPQPRRHGGPGISPDARRRFALALAGACILVTALAQRGAAQADPDEAYVGPLLNQALETEKSDEAIPWNNPATGSRGTIVIERTFYRDPRTPCRDYRRTIERPGVPVEEIQGTGCRVGPGRWTLDEEGADAVTGAFVGATPRAPEPPGPPAPEPAAGPPSCPALTAVPVPCDKPPAVADYTMPSKTEL